MLSVPGPSIFEGRCGSDAPSFAQAGDLSSPGALIGKPLRVGARIEGVVVARRAIFKVVPSSNPASG